MTFGRLHELLVTFFAFPFAVRFIVLLAVYFIVPLVVRFIIVPFAAMVGTTIFYQLFSRCFYTVIFWVSNAVM